LQLYFIPKNPNQCVAQHPLSFIVRSPTCFGQIHWHSSWSHMQRRFNLELPRAVTAVVVFIIMKLLKSCCS